MRDVAAFIGEFGSVIDRLSMDIIVFKKTIGVKEASQESQSAIQMTRDLLLYAELSPLEADKPGIERARASASKLRRCGKSCNLREERATPDADALTVEAKKSMLKRDLEFTSPTALPPPIWSGAPSPTRGGIR
ncbi:MAG: hypothetical protein ACR2PG_22810 [Hyphomicrobiaceae bacterium]